MPLPPLFQIFGITLNMGEGPSAIPQSQGELKIIKGEAAQQDTNDTTQSLAAKRL